MKKSELDIRRLHIVNKMQAKYPNKIFPISWDTLNINYPVRRFPGTGISSENIARKPRGVPEIMPGLKVPLEEEIKYSRNYLVPKDLLQSQATLDYSYKQAERKRHNKHTSCTENLYVYPPSRKLSDRAPNSNVHGTTETRSAFTQPVVPSRLVTDKEQYLHPAILPLDPPTVEPFYKQIEPLDTTHEGYEKYLDPYLTTSRLYHRPYTAEQLARVSNTRDVMTYYTYSGTPWVRSSKPNTNEWRLPLSRPKSMYDREKFKEDFREIRTHNKLIWTPGSFRTENNDNYKNFTTRPESNIPNYEDDVRSYFQKVTAELETNIPEESSFQNSTENSIIGSRKPVCSVIDQFVEQNKRLQCKRKG